MTERNPILPDFDNLDGDDILVSELPISSHTSLIAEDIADIFYGKNMPLGDDFDDLGFSDEYQKEVDNNIDDIIRFVSHNKKLLIVGESLEVLQSHLVYRRVVTDMQKPKNMKVDLVLTNFSFSSYESIASHLPDTFNTTFSLSKIGKEYGNPINLWTYGDPYPYDMMCARGLDGVMRFRLQQERRGNKKGIDASINPVRYIVDYEKENVHEFNTMRFDINNLIKRSTRVAI